MGFSCHPIRQSIGAWSWLLLAPGRMGILLLVVTLKSRVCSSTAGAHMLPVAVCSPSADFVFRVKVSTNRVSSALTGE